MSNSLQPHGLQHIRLPCPTLSTGVCSNSWPLSQWCHPNISSSVTPFSSGVTPGGLSLKELVHFMQIIKFTGLELIVEFPCVCVLSHFSCVWLFVALWTAAHQAPLSVGFSRKTRILEWVAMPSSRGSSWPRDWTHVFFSSCITDRFFTAEPPGKLVKFPY